MTAGLPVGARSLIAGFREMRARAEGVGTATLVMRLVAWRLASLMVLRPIIAVHDRSRLRLAPARHQHGIAKGIFLLRDHYEPSVRHVIDATLHPGDTALDIGANMGLWSLRMAERVGPAGRVLAFEPGLRTLPQLRTNIRLSDQSQIEIHAVALGAAHGELTLHTPADSGSASLGDPGGQTQDDQVPVRPLDAIWTAAGRPCVRLIKMDVEGAEPMVLAGATALFAAIRPVVCCEINPSALAALGFRAEDIFAFFEERGYRTMIWDGCRQELKPLTLGDEPYGSKVCDVVFEPGAAPGQAGSA